MRSHFKIRNRLKVSINNSNIYISGLELQKMKDRQFNDLKLLLVENNPMNQRAVIETLKGAGVKIDVAENGREAVDAVQKKNYDVVLMEIQMPEMDGMEATRIMRREPGLSTLPIIAITAHTMKSDLEQYLQAGMNDYVSKPIDRDQLFKAIHKNVPKSTGFDPLFSSPRLQVPAAGDRGVDALPGLNVQKGVERIGGSVELYIDIVKEYCASNRHFADEFVSLLDKEDLSAAKTKAHTLKGTAGNISADELYLATQALEKACNEGDVKKIKHILAGVAEKLQEVMDAAGRLDTLLDSATR